jgi:aarF domain-containing kinase
LILTAAAALSPVAFVQLSEKDNGGTKQTAEGRMLEASRDEIKKEVREDVRGIWRLRDSIVLFLDVYLWEPLCTGTRFLHLVVIFVPVIATVPMIWIGRRNKERDDERSGTLWWYWFLVKSMERAGPAFIKVAPPLPVPRLSSLFPAWTMGSFANRYLPNPDV